MRLILSLIIFFSLPFAAQGQNFPSYTSTTVNDFADLLPDGVKADIATKLNTFRNKTGVEFTVVTIRRMSDYGHNGSIERFATGLFNHWGVGNAIRNDGVMMLVSRFDRKIRLEVGSGYGSRKNRAMKRIIETDILPQFRKDLYSVGISNGVDAVIADINATPKNRNAIQRFLSEVWYAVERFWVGILILLSPMFAGVLWSLNRWFRNRPRRCPIDGSTMYRLEESEEDPQLSVGQKAEEAVLSVDYDVWCCPICPHVTIKGYGAWFSSYGPCEKCSHRTAEGKTTVEVEATTFSTGRRRIDYTCVNCKAKYTKTEVISKISESSSSSGGSSFGGGSSSGGGASGSW